MWISLNDHPTSEIFQSLVSQYDSGLIYYLRASGYLESLSPQQLSWISHKIRFKKLYSEFGRTSSASDKLRFSDSYSKISLGNLCTCLTETSYARTRDLYKLQAACLRPRQAETLSTVDTLTSIPSTFAIALSQSTSGFYQRSMSQIDEVVPNGHPIASFALDRLQSCQKITAIESLRAFDSKYGYVLIMNLLQVDVVRNMRRKYV